MEELSLTDIDVVAGGVDSGEASLEIGMVSLAIGIVASGPVGWVGAGAAAATSFGGGLFFGNAIANDGDWRGYLCKLAKNKSFYWPVSY